MGIKSRTQLKKYFKKGAYPTEAQFGDLIDSLCHKEEPLAMADVEGLTPVLNSKLNASEGATMRNTLEELIQTIDELEERLEYVRDSLSDYRYKQGDFIVDFGTGHNLTHFMDNNGQSESIAENCSEGDRVYVQINNSVHNTRVLQIESYAVLLIEVSDNGGVFVWELNYFQGDCGRIKI